MNQRNFDALRKAVSETRCDYLITRRDVDEFVEALCARGVLGPATEVLTEHDCACLAQPVYVDAARIERIAKGEYLDGEGP